MSAFVDNYRYLARYNQWFNTRLYEACSRLDEAARQADRGAFFGSIHHTLNHILVADCVWLGRLRRTGQDFGVDVSALPERLIALPAGWQLSTVLHADGPALLGHRQALDSALLAWVDGLPEAFVLAPMRYANTQGVQREHPVWQALTHLFNHQTHHRGQVSTLLAQAGVDVGVTDLIVLAGT